MSYESKCPIAYAIAHETIDIAFDAVLRHDHSEKIKAVIAQRNIAALHEWRCSGLMYSEDKHRAGRTIANLEWGV